MSKISAISASMDVNTSPWSIEVITPSDNLIAKFHNWDNTKSTSSRLRSFNRARKWISDLLKRHFKVPEAHKLRHCDIVNALDDMINTTAMPILWVQKWLRPKTYQKLSKVQKSNSQYLVLALQVPQKL